MLKVPLLLAAIFFFISGCSSLNPVGSQRKLATESARIFYVDAEHGDDLNEAILPAAAWRTIGKVNSARFNPGDSLLFRRGQEWKEGLVVQSSGQPDLPIRIGSYGEGPLPVFSGAVDISRVTWKSVRRNVWATALKADAVPPERIFIESKAVDDHLARASSNDIGKEREWAWEPIDGGTLFIYSLSPPDQWRQTIEVNVRRRGIMLGKQNSVSISDLNLKHFREGIWIGGSHCSVENVISNQNSFSGITIVGSSNSVRDVHTSNNGVDVKPNDAGAHGLGLLINGSDNEIRDFISNDNAEDGVQTGPEAGNGNRFVNAKMKGNRENCFDIKSGDQTIIGGDVKSDALTSADCVLVHKVPHRVRIENLHAMSTTKGPALHIMQGASADVVDSFFKAEDSSAVLIGDAAGDGTTIRNSVLAGGGRRSKYLIEIRAGKNHVVEGNELTLEPSVKAVLVAPDAQASIQRNVVTQAK